MLALTALYFFVIPVLSIRERLFEFPQFTMPSSSSSILQVNLPTVSTQMPPLTMDLTFRIDAFSGVNFFLMGFANIGMEYSTGSLKPVSIPSPCVISSTLEANTWYHITYAVTSINLVKFAIGQSVEC